MAHVSLILTVIREGALPVGHILEARHALEAAGHEVEVLVAAGPGVTIPENIDPVSDGRWVSVQETGRAAVALAGLAQAKGDILLVVDPTSHYRSEDLVGVAAAVEEGHGDLVVASRWMRGPIGPGRLMAVRKRVGVLARYLTGSTDPLSSLVGLRRDAVSQAAGSFRAVGSQFALELLAKVPGRRFDLPTTYRPTLARLKPGLDELRHLKRLADHRFGDASRLLQFCAVGASGMIIDLTCYAGFQVLLAPTVLSQSRVPFLGGLDLATARILAVLIALTWNFTLNRRMTFSDSRHGSILKQYLAYALSNALAITLNLTLSLWLPNRVAFFNVHRLAAAVVGIVLATALSFSMARWVVFRRHPPAPLASPVVPDDSVLEPSAIV